ncbi:CDP-glycerol glycerophosphotransferase [Evansella vedderi]|uniref:CDP-glycerol glycerophosphotransferase n=1 Tax=Evansella vedderi TaxID=38282 RepID=A0ABT9ZU35_9BACI|nr:CDP-glycerol:glycerophosphate glycerophosphotransferase [Evansella vedderi]MDQ0254450.1 CDP-glycerol glycerophosphotransferase [Evansella vedderi]
MKSVSIVTPVKENDRAFITDLYTILRNQMLTNFEWIIITDGNFTLPINHTDELSIKVMENELEPGVAGARNTGINHATKDYVYFLDSDDIITEHTLFCLGETASIEEVDIVIGQLKRQNKKLTIPDSYNAMFTRLLKDRHVNASEAKTKHLRSSSLNMLFRRELLMENDIRFDSSLKLFSDMPFNFAAFDKADKILYDQDAFYLKTVRNEFDENPSLQQELQQEIIYYYPLANKQARNGLEQDKFLTILDNRLIKAYYYTYVREIYSNDKDKKYILERWSDALHQLSEDSLSNKKRYAAMEIRALASGKVTKARNLAKFRILVNNVKEFKQKKPAQRKVFIYQKLLTKLPIKKNLILYESFSGKSFSDSPKYIYRYINTNYGSKYKNVWVFENSRTDLTEIKDQVKRLSLKHIYYLARAEFLVCNARQPVWFEKREEQTYLQTWHGTPLKKLGMDIEEVHMPGTTTEKYKANFTNEASQWDYLVSPNNYSSEIFRRAFLFHNELLEYGYPRNDILNSPDKEVYGEKIKEKLGIPKGKKVVLYAPTWRDDEFYGKGQYKFQLKLDLKRINKELGDDYYFILRTHYLIADKLDVEGVEDFVYNGSNYDDIAELYLISDILITDYSSVFFDYANLKRPILFYAYDLDKYKDTLRGFYLNHETEWPGPILKTNDEVIQTLKDIDKEYGPYFERLNHFHDEFCEWDDGHAAKNCAEEVIIGKSKE